MREVFLMFPLEGQVWAVKASLAVQAGTPDPGILEPSSTAVICF